MAASRLGRLPGPKGGFASAGRRAYRKPTTCRQRVGDIPATCDNVPAFGRGAQGSVVLPSCRLADGHGAPAACRAAAERERAGSVGRRRTVPVPMRAAGRPRAAHGGGLHCPGHPLPGVHLCIQRFPTAVVRVASVPAPARAAHLVRPTDNSQQSPTRSHPDNQPCTDSPGKYAEPVECGLDKPYGRARRVAADPAFVFPRVTTSG
jgi:hypothetical protein